METWYDVIEAQAMLSTDPIDPQRVYHELSSKIPNNAIITADFGTTADWYSRYIEMERDVMGISRTVLHR
jgi:pyruvate dehydrogenase (quinone)